MKRFNMALVFFGMGLMVLGLMMTSLYAQEGGLPPQFLNAKCVTMTAPYTCYQTGTAACQAMATCDNQQCYKCHSPTTLPAKVCSSGFPGEKCGASSNQGTSCSASDLKYGRCTSTPANLTCLCVGNNLVSECPSQPYYPCN